MADDITKRIARFIEPFRVKPGLEREAGEGLRSGFQGGDQEEEGRSRTVEGRHRAASGLPGAARGSGHLRRLGGAPGTRRRGQGRDDPPRDEWCQPAGCAGRELQGSFGPRAQPGLPAPLPGTAAVARRDRHLQPVPLRGGACRPGASREPRAPEAPGRDARATRLETQVRSDQRLGAVPVRQRLPDREALPEPLEGGATRPLSEAHRPPRAQLEVLVRTMSRSAGPGTPTRRRSRRCSVTPAPSGRPGT